MPTIKNRRAPKSQWSAANPVLAAGEIGYEIDTNKLKVGDGVKTWEQLTYFVDENALKNNFTPALAPGWSQRWFGGAIRNLGSAGGYWQPIDDGAHWPFGMPSVVTTTVGIEVNYDFEAAGIGTVIVSPDETLSTQGWSAGASVEKNKATLKIGRNKTIADRLTWNGTSWVSLYGVASVSWDTSGGGQMIVSHEKMLGQSYSVSAAGGVVDAVLSTSGPNDPGTKTHIQLFDKTTNAQITTNAAVPNNTRVYISRTDAFANGSINPQSAPDQTELPNSNLWIFGVHHTAPRPN
ncbi:tail fiber protein [Rhodococcus phage ReqiPepy6]|uniref:Tail fiber protein n=1 Tax=Rhodococcus phage ReqiPepy6 TaxID=691965 RepID=D4P7B5_9CAUD|nr:tail fiber protein [Rhodococcus phage ReqiPepy6]ADD80895.1 tail fiber protein [Rhodococcus phage ReqiPepy6]